MANSDEIRLLTLNIFLLYGRTKLKKFYRNSVFIEISKLISPTLRSAAVVQSAESSTLDRGGQDSRLAW